MKIYCFGALIAVLHLVAAPFAFAQTASDFQTPATHLIILDHDSGEILFEKNAREAMYPASMTKIMTATIVFDRIKSGALSLDDEFMVSEDAWTRGGTKSGSSTMFLKPNSMVKVRDLLRGVIVQSGNDACIVLAQGIAGSEAAFADLMNAKAKSLGLDTAHFVNSTGWPDPNHKISAFDLARLARHSIETYPEMYKIYGERRFTWNGISQDNRNPLFGSGIDGVDGLKTGHTEVSKYGFVGSGTRDGERRVFVVNGLETNSARRSESRRVMRSAFGEFKSYSVYKSGQKAGSAPVFMGKAETVSLVASEDILVGLHKPSRSAMKIQIKYQGPIPAPITKGDYIADMIITAPGRADETVALFAGEDVARKSMFGRMTASLVQKIRGE